jgi:hypothetical protein
MQHSRLWRFATGLLFLLVLPTTARSWGAPGHEIVAAIANARLTPPARRLVRELVGDEPLSDPGIATWADALRDPATRPWHYVNIPMSSGRYDARRDCARGCAVSTIERAVAELQGSGPAMRRADALRWLVHVVADIHQPLHAGDGWDRGGNALPVRFGRRRQPTNLHHVWDSEVVHPLLGHRRGPLGAARDLDVAITPQQAAAWAANLDPAAWAEESSREARDVYAELGRRPGDTSLLALPASYPATQRRRVELALERAGVRLAALLDRAARAQVRK